jgi:MoaA/NifB/PqqE/SkfB family radical SAM enzyme
MLDFPTFVSLTVTNHCNLRCQMCAQWSKSGYMHQGKHAEGGLLTLADWRRVVDEVSERGNSFVLVRGGEPFMYPQIIELLEHIAGRGMFTSIDSNGTRLAQFADDLVRLERVHVTVSVDGPEAIHDAVRGRPGCFAEIAAGIAALKAAEQRAGKTISKSITFTISPWSYKGLGAMPEVARSLGIESLCIVPFFHLPQRVGQEYARQLREEFDCDAYSWRGACHEESGVDIDAFCEQLRQYKSTIGAIHDYPYLPLQEEEYRTWFGDAVAPVRSEACTSIERVLDIQPNGDANFCVDYPDFKLGNVRQASLAELWNGERANQFRARRRQGAFGACHRCVAKYMAVDRTA